MPALDIADDGFIDVTIAGVRISVDCYATWNKLVGLRDRLTDEDKPIEDFHAGVVDFLAELGFPRVSHRAADRFADAMAMAVDALKKNDNPEPTPASPVPTGPAS